MNLYLFDAQGYLKENLMKRSCDYIWKRAHLPLLGVVPFIQIRGKHLRCCVQYCIKRRKVKTENTYEAETIFFHTKESSCNAKFYSRHKIVPKKRVHSDFFFSLKTYQNKEYGIFQCFFKLISERDQMVIIFCWFWS